jgi:hypothetical protein
VARKWGQYKRGQIVEYPSKIGQIIKFHEYISTVFRFTDVFLQLMPTDRFSLWAEKRLPIVIPNAELPAAAANWCHQISTYLRTKCHRVYIRKPLHKIPRNPTPPSPVSPERRQLQWLHVIKSHMDLILTSTTESQSNGPELSQGETRTMTTFGHHVWTSNTSNSKTVWLNWFKFSQIE